jgi:hypothetical protein
MDLNTLMQEIRTLWRRIAGLEARVANLPVRPALGGQVGNIIPCRVQQNGGSAGDSTTNCSFTYDIYALDNSSKVNTSGGAVTPKGTPRVAKVTYTAATYGHYYLDTDGSYVLLLYNEAPAQEDCS